MACQRDALNQGRPVSGSNRNASPLDERLVPPVGTWTQLFRRCLGARRTRVTLRPMRRFR